MCIALGQFCFVQTVASLVCEPIKKSDLHTRILHLCADISKHILTLRERPCAIHTTCHSLYWVFMDLHVSEQNRTFDFSVNLTHP